MSNHHETTKTDIWRQKGRKKPTRKRGKMHAMYVYIAQWTELHEEIWKSQQPIDLNTLMQNHKNDLKKPYTKIYEKCSCQLLYDETRIKKFLSSRIKNKKNWRYLNIDILESSNINNPKSSIIMNLQKNC